MWVGGLGSPGFSEYFLRSGVYHSTSYEISKIGEYVMNSKIKFLKNQRGKDKIEERCKKKIQGKDMKLRKAEGEKSEGRKIRET